MDRQNLRRLMDLLLYGFLSTVLLYLLIWSATKGTAVKPGDILSIIGLLVTIWGTMALVKDDLHGRKESEPRKPASTWLERWIIHTLDFFLLNKANLILIGIFLVVFGVLSRSS